MESSPLTQVVVFSAGAVPITLTVVTTWAIMLVLAVLCWIASRRLSLHPGGWQTFVELVVETIAEQLRDVINRDPEPFLPLIGTLLIFLTVANVSGVLPGVEPPTARIETDAALGVIVFFSVHVYGIRARGLGGYLRAYLKPSPFLLPLNVLSEFTRIFSLMIRLFGNVMSHGFVIAIVISLAGLLVPIPIMALAILIGLVQAYIFTVLAAVFIGAALGSTETERKGT